MHCEIGGTQGPLGYVSALGATRLVHWLILVAPSCLRSHNARYIMLKSLSDATWRHRSDQTMVQFKCWFRWWLVACRHQAITWANTELSSVRSCVIHPRVMSQVMFKISILDMNLKIVYPILQLLLPGENKLTQRNIVFQTIYVLKCVQWCLNIKNVPLEVFHKCLFEPYV